MTDQALLELQNVEIRRGGARVLEVPLLAVRSGEVVCLAGPNGSGKTTLLLAMACLLERHAGALAFRGAAVDGAADELAYRRRTAMVFQEPLLFDTTVQGNVAAGLKIRGLSRKETERRVGEALERFRISHLAARSARRLSGGEAQRTSLARAFATAPDILFLDEPFSCLDPPTREALIDDLERIFRDTGLTVVMSSHDQAEALRLADTMAVLRQGRIVQAGAPERVINFPADEFVASFVGMGTVVKGTVLQAGQGTVTVSAGDRMIEAIGEAACGSAVILCIRPENVILAPPQRFGPDSCRNHFPALITRVIPLGHYVKIQLDCGFPLAAHVTNSSREELGLREGARVCASFKATAVHLLRQA